MSAKKTTPEIVKTEKEPQPKIDDTDRLRLAEIWYQIVATRNGLTALEVKKISLEVEKQNIDLQMQLQTQRGENLQARLLAVKAELYKKYNVPSSLEFDVTTGVVVDPQQPQQNAGPPLVQATK